MIADSLRDPLYYLANFINVLRWVSARHDDLLSRDERAFIATFLALPQPSQALLVRMIMRKGELFRPERLMYDEIGDTTQALTPLIEAGLIDAAPQLTLGDLFALFNREELVFLFGPWLSRPRDRKAALKQALDAEFDQSLTSEQWTVITGKPLSSGVIRLTVMPVCERLRLMFFGNLRQQFSEFVLADQGIYRFETVPITAASRAFQSRTDIERYWQMHQCSERFEAGEAVEAVLADLPGHIENSVWLEARRGRLLYRMAHYCERQGELACAAALYADSGHHEARIRLIRTLEKLEHYDKALALCRAVEAEPANEAERQHLRRIVPRLHRLLGLEKPPVVTEASARRLDLLLPQSGSVERAVCGHLSTSDAPVVYVENVLINGLFGLLCWEAIFAPLPGAFFHPFQSGPADLMRPDFYPRREALFHRCLTQLDSSDYRTTIWRHYQQKQGLQSPFVHWGALDETLLELALNCLPAAHLRLWFERLLTDIRANRAGMPDLIRFYPHAEDDGAPRYEMIEVKGPGDRLQDNQKRWIAFCARHGMPVTVCHVRWADEEEDA